MTVHGDLRGPRLRLRPLAATDLTDTYLGWLNDPDVRRYLSVGPGPVVHEDLVRYLDRTRSGSNEVFAIIELDTDRHIGNVALNGMGDPSGTADTGLLIGAKDKWGRGYAREAWSLAICHAFEAHGLRRIMAGSCVSNTASIAALQGLGFVVEGLLRQECLVEGRHEDVVRLGLLAAEFRPTG